MKRLTDADCADLLCDFRTGRISPQAWTALYLQHAELRAFTADVIAYENAAETYIEDAWERMTKH